MKELSLWLALTAAAVAADSPKEFQFLPEAYATGQVGQAARDLIVELSALEQRMANAPDVEEGLRLSARRDARKQAFRTEHGAAALCAAEEAYCGWKLSALLPSTNVIAHLLTEARNLKQECAVAEEQQAKAVAKALTEGGVEQEQARRASRDVAKVAGGETTPIVVALMVRGIQCPTPVIDKLAAMPKPKLRNPVAIYRAVLLDHGLSGEQAYHVKNILGP